MANELTKEEITEIQEECYRHLHLEDEINFYEITEIKEGKCTKIR